MIVGGLRKDGVMTDYELSSVKKVIGTHFKKAAELSCYLREHPELPDQEFLEQTDKYELDPELKKWGNNVWHGMVGIYKIQEDLGLTDSEILRSIEIHTVGSYEMSILDKIVYVADYIEHNRNFPLVEEARQVAEQSLDKAVAFETVHTVEHLAHKVLPIFPQTLETYNAFVHYLKD